MAGAQHLASAAAAARRRPSPVDVPAPAARLHVPSFAWTLVRTDFKIRYHGSLGGFVWAILRPLSLFLVLQAVFTLIFNADPAYRLNLAIGVFLWDFFVEATRSGLTSLAAKAHLLTKIRVPGWVVVFASACNAVVTLALFTAIILGALMWTGRTPSPWQVLLFLAYLAQFLGIILGFSLAASVVFLRYRDLNQLWDLATQVGFFAAPIVYPLGILPERLHFYLYLWPPTAIIQFSRSVLVLGEIPTLTAHLYLMAETVCALTGGAVVFRRYVRRGVELL